MKVTAGLMLIVFSATSLLLACSSAPSMDDVKRSNARAAYNRRRDAFMEQVRLGSPPPNYQSQVDKVIAGTLKDPDSRRVEFFKPKSSNLYGGLVCGQVNAKNSFGGYTGFTSFAAVFDSSHNLLRTILLEDSSDPYHIEVNEETTTKQIAYSNC